MHGNIHCHLVLRGVELLTYACLVFFPDIIPVDVFIFLDLYGNNNLSKVVLPMVSQEWDGTPFSGSRTS
jgi:hypothetical protein